MSNVSRGSFEMDQLDNSTNTAGEKFFAPILLILSVVICFSYLSGRDLWEPNEPISAEAAREMMQSGDWLLPTVNGELYPDKPPLLFWGIALASLPTGKVNETTARVPSAAAGASLILMLYFLARRTLGSRAAFLASLTLAVSSFFVEQSRYVQHDMLLLLGVTVGTLAMFGVADGEKPVAGWMGLAALALGFGVLAKGPVALVLPAFMIVLDTLFERRLFRRWGWLLLAGALGLVLPLAYYLALVQQHGPELVQGFLFRHNVNRFVKGFDHLQPWWFFLVRTPVDFLPLSLFVPAAALFRPQETERKRTMRRLWIWILVPLVFFSLSASKRPIYMLPAISAVALLCGVVLDAAARGELKPGNQKLVRIIQVVLLALLGVAGVAAPLLAARKAPELMAAAWFLALFAIAGSLFGLWKFKEGKVLAAHGGLVAGLLMVWMVVFFWAYPAANQKKSPRTFSEILKKMVPPDSPLKAYGLYRFRSGYLFYTERLMPRIEEIAEVETYLARGERVFFIMPCRDLENLQKTISHPAHLLARGSAGHREECLLSNQPSSEPESRWWQQNSEPVTSHLSSR